MRDRLNLRNIWLLANTDPWSVLDSGKYEIKIKPEYQKQQLEYDIDTITRHINALTETISSLQTELKSKQEELKNIK